jgi:hypothetical protein
MKIVFSDGVVTPSLLNGIRFGWRGIYTFPYACGDEPDGALVAITDKGMFPTDVGIKT